MAALVELQRHMVQDGRRCERSTFLRTDDPSGFHEAPHALLGTFRKEQPCLVRQRLHLPWPVAHLLPLSCHLTPGGCCIIHAPYGFQYKGPRSERCGSPWGVVGSERV